MDTILKNDPTIEEEISEEALKDLSNNKGDDEDE